MEAPAAGVGVPAAAPAEAAPATVVALTSAVAACVWWRSSSHMTMPRFTNSNSAIAMAHSGKRVRGGATRTSNSAGPLCRWRSLSDFFSASRMNDIDSPAVMSIRCRE